MPKILKEFPPRGKIVFFIARLFGSIFCLMLGILSLGVFAVAVLYFFKAVVAFNSVGLTVVSDVLNELLLYFPNIFVALVILVIGFYLARFVAGLVQVFAGNIGIEKPDVMGKIAYAVVIIFIIPVALNQLNIASDLITSAFLLLFGALCLALALAFGLGSKDLVLGIWEKSKFADKIKPKKE